MVVFVEASVLEDPALARDPRFQGVRDRLQTFRDGTDDLQVLKFVKLYRERMEIGSKNKFSCLIFILFYFLF